MSTGKATLRVPISHLITLAFLIAGPVLIIGAQQSQGEPFERMIAGGFPPGLLEGRSAVSPEGSSASSEPVEPDLPAVYADHLAGNAATARDEILRLRLVSVACVAGACIWCAGIVNMAFGMVRSPRLASTATENEPTGRGCLV